MIAIANVISKLQTVKTFVRALSKNRCFRERVDSQHVKLSEILAKSSWKHSYHLCSSFWENLIWKMSPPVLGEILGIFVDRMPADGQYPVEYHENLRLPIQMQLSKKQKAFFSIFCSISEIYIKFQTFWKKRWWS